MGVFEFYVSRVVGFFRFTPIGIKGCCFFTAAGI